MLIMKQMNNKKRAQPYCEENLQLNPDSLPALLFKARRQIDSEEYEAAMQTLNHAKEHHPGASQIGPLLQKAHMLLKRSKNKDYYKVLEVSNDADERTIKKAYRTLIKKYHPDKAVASGMSKDESEKKMAAINEAYEVLSDPEKKAQFDRGDDPNSHENQNQGNPFQGSPFGGAGQQFFFQSGGGGGGQRFQFQGGFPFGGGM
jgi:DnaJ family protein C protein 3